MNAPFMVPLITHRSMERGLTSKGDVTMFLLPTVVMAAKPLLGFKPKMWHVDRQVKGIIFGFHRCYIVSGV